MRISPSLLLSWAKALRDPGRAAKQLANLMQVSKLDLVEQAASAGHLISELISSAFKDGRRDAIEVLRPLSLALEELHSLLLQLPDLPPSRDLSTWRLSYILASSTLSDLRAGLEKASSSGGLDQDSIKALSSLASDLKGLKAVLEVARALGPSPPAHVLLKAIKDSLPTKLDLAAISVVLAYAPEARKDKEAFTELLASLLEKGMIELKEGTEDGYMRIPEAAAWLSQLLGLSIERGEVLAALRALKSRGLVRHVDERSGLALISPREEDVKAAFELAKDVCKHARLRVREALFIKHFGWKPGYASAIIEELASRGLLVSNSNSWLPVSEEQAKSLLVEAESCFEADLLEEAAKLYQLASRLFTKLSEEAEGLKLELLLAEASYCDFMQVFCEALALRSSLRRAAISGLPIDIKDIDRLKRMIRTANKCLNEALKRLSKLISAAEGSEVAKIASEVVDLIDKKADKFKDLRAEVEGL
ncbi:MAG TPA: hypothetical protein ENF78_00085 [Candidatus Bathyarchaeota archaeon]|nr:hypothetical protein [Candidatus Bathyarchaeota archaeon]